MKNKFSYFLLITVFILVLISPLPFNLQAAEAEIDIGDVIKETEQQPAVEAEEPDIPELKEEELRAPLKDLGGRKVLVEEIIITGNNVLSTEKLEGLVNTEEYTGKKISFVEMENAALAITRYYRKEGYFVARAYIPVQEMEDNTLEITVIEGNYGEFILKNNSLVRDKTVQAMLDAVKSKNIISVDTIERAMLIINDTPGAVVTQADVMPGEKVGTSDFAITASPSSRYSGYLLADNYGSDYTGEDRLTAALNINSPFTLGDRITLRGMLTDYSGIENYRLSYSLPITYSGWRTEFYYADTEYELGDIYSVLNIIGESQDLGVSFSYPSVRTRLKNTEFFADFKYRDLADRQDGTITAEKEIKKLNTGFEYEKNYRLFDFNSQRLFNTELTMGELKRTPDNSDFEDTAGIYSKINFELAENIDFNSRWSLESSLRAQYALGDKNLDGSEDFSLGGITGVKLYPSGEFSAENGYLINLELIYKLPNINHYSHSLSIFYDRGYADMADEVVGFEDRTLQDLGLGYHADYKDFFANISLAYKIDDEDITSEEDYDSRALIQAGFVF